MNNKHISLWTKNFIAFFFANFFMNLGAQFLFPTLPLYSISVLGANQSQVGYIIGAYSFAALLVRPLSGYAYDYIGRKKVFTISLLLFTIITITYPFAATFLMLILFRFIHGLAFGLTSTGGGTIIGDVVPEKRRGEGVGYFGLANTLSMALGPAIGLWIMAGNKFNNLFLSSGILIGVSLILAMLISLPKNTAKSRKITLNSFFEKRVVRVSIIMSLVGVVLGGVLSYIIIFSLEIGIVNGGLYFIVNSAGVVLTRLFAGKILDKHGPKPIIIFGFIVLSLGFIVLSVCNNLTVFLLASFLIGLGNGTIMPTLQTMVINMVEPEKRGVASSTFFAFMDIGIGGGSIFLGWLTSIVTLKTMFLISGIFILLPFLLFLTFVLHDYEKKASQLHSDNNL